LNGCPNPIGSVKDLDFDVVVSMQLIALTFIQGRITAAVGVEAWRLGIPTLTSPRLPFPIPSHVATDLASSKHNGGSSVVAREFVKGLVKWLIFWLRVLGGLVNEFLDG
jgi:hypothetical protein